MSGGGGDECQRGEGPSERFVIGGAGLNGDSRGEITALLFTVNTGVECDPRRRINEPRILLEVPLLKPCQA